MICGKPNHHELDIGSQEIRIHFYHEVEIVSLLKYHHFIIEYLPFATVFIGHGLYFSFEVHIFFTCDGVKRNLCCFGWLCLFSRVQILFICSIHGDLNLNWLTWLFEDFSFPGNKFNLESVITWFKHRENRGNQNRLSTFQSRIVLSGYHISSL